MSDNELWTWKDAWLLAHLAALASHERTTTLEYLYGSADALNDPILTPDEIASGLQRLSVAGLISASRYRYAITNAGARVAGPALVTSDVHERLGKLSFTFLQKHAKRRTRFPM